jgi:hypothetical protein
MIRRTWRGLVAGLALTTAVGLTAAPAEAAPHQAPAIAPPAPDKDPFYQPPEGYESKAPGTILRSRPGSLALFSLFKEKVKAWQVLYRSTDAEDKPMATAALVLVPENVPSPSKDRPLVAYQVAEDSLALKCAPSYQMQAGVFPENPVVQAEVLLVNGLLKNGWAVVVPDHEGPRSAYAAGILAGHATLDSIRAAESLPEAGLSAKAPVGMMGYSGGSIATGWAAELQPSYAPELNVKAVAEGGVGADLDAAVRNINGGPFGGYALGGALGVGRAHPELGAYIDSILNAEGKDLAKRLGESCNSMIVLQGLFKDINKLTTKPDPFDDPIPRKVMALNKMGRRTPTAPMFIFHSVNDELLPVKPVDDLVKTYCANGASVSYNRDQLSEHITLVATGAPLELAWMQDRLSGKPAQPGCTTKTHTSMALDPSVPKILQDYLQGMARLF